MSARATNPMRNANRFKLGLFSINADGGTAFTKVENRWRAEWSEIEALARIADAAGLEFILPIARWKGYGGETKVRGASFETLTHAAALAAITRHIAIFSTVHVPLVHPVFAAKALMTVDHVSRGRAGLNIVCGWNQEEFDMFGHRQSDHDDRYKQGFEWFSVLLRIFAAEVPFDHEGEFYKLKQVIGAPAPVQQPRPVTLSAAFSPAGRRFAAATSDFLFTSLRSFESAKPQIAEIRRLAVGGRSRRRGTDHDACRLPGDRRRGEAVLRLLRGRDGRYRSGRHSPAQEGRALRRRRARCRQARAAAICRRHRQLSADRPTADDRRRDRPNRMQLGFSGATISFVNFNEELPYFVDRVLPLLRQADLRESDAMMRPDTRRPMPSRLSRARPENREIS